MLQYGDTGDTGLSLDSLSMSLFFFFFFRNKLMLIICFQSLVCYKSMYC